MNKEPSIWGFDLGKGSSGEAVRRIKDNTFPHIDSLLIPPELARRGPAALSGTPANRYRAMKTREAHHARERWLETVWRGADLIPLQAREVWENPNTQKWELKCPADYRLEREFAPKQFKTKNGQKVRAEYPSGKAADGAPAATPQDFEICYTSCLLRIKLLQWREGDPKLEEWQVYKALRSALQRRGYGPVPWAAKEARKVGKTKEEIQEEEEKKLQQADPRYREAAGRWPDFKRTTPTDFHFPCYYDAFQMGLWNPAEPKRLLPRLDHRAGSTRNVRFDRADLEREFIQLAKQANVLLNGKLDVARESLIANFKAKKRMRIQAINERRKLKNASLPPEMRKKLLAEPSFAKLTENIGEFLCYGPTGEAYASFKADLRKDVALHPGSADDWMGALGQKIPRFENRILNDCVLIPRYHVCKVDVRLETEDRGKPAGGLVPESLLASEVTLLMKLKNLLLSDAAEGQRKLTVEEVRDIFAFSKRRLKRLRLLTDDGELVNEWPKKVAECLAINQSKWKTIGAEGEFLTRFESVRLPDAGPLAQDEAELLLRVVAEGKKGLECDIPERLQPLLKAAKAEWKKAKQVADDTLLRPLPGHKEVKAPRTSGRAAYSRVALRILKELILFGEAPSAFHSRLLRRDPELLRRLGPSPEKPLAIFDDSKAGDEKQRTQEDTENRKRGLLVSELNFLRQMRKNDATEDSWDNIFIPAQTLDALQQRHTKEGRLDADAAIRELLGTINDPIVRHRLEVFNTRLEKLEFGDEKEGIPACGVPDAIVLEFVREDFMGEEAKRALQNFQRERENDRAEAKTMAENAGAKTRLSALKYQLWKAQGGECLYGKEVFEENGNSKAQCIYRETALPLSRLDEYVIDHIVPRAQGGPDAMVNYVLTTSGTNDEKGDRTPFEWLHNSSGWDAYVKRVEARATALRNKKVQLLTREAAPELVERYTALAETAWVSKLAQTIVNLRFGWKNGVDYSGPQPVKRVIVVSGGLTARVRRKYSLDKLLYTDVTDPDVLTKKVKNREDKRHHALDAMVLTFIPQWARDPSKEGFFRFPAEFRDATGREDYQSIRRLLAQHISKVMPHNIAYERAALADKHFGQRLDGGSPVIVKRVAVFDLAQEQAGAPGKTIFSLKYLTKKIETVRDETIKRRIKEEFLDQQPDEAGWRKFCDSFTQQRKDGTPGARIVKVWVNAAEDTEFADLSKDGKGAWRKGEDDHKGQIIYTNAEGNLAVKPVYAHASIKRDMQQIAEIGGKSKVHCFVRSKCLFRVTKELLQSDYKQVIKNEQNQKRRIQALNPLPPAKYMLNTIITASMDVEFTAANGQKFVAPLRVLIAAGFEPVK